MRFRSALVVALALASVALPRPRGAQAQTRVPSPASLERVDSLIAEGRTEDARATLVAWMERPSEGRGGGGTARRPPTVTRADAQRAVWLRALLTVDPVQAAVDFQRLLVEYPGGPYSDRALLRLAQTAQAQGDQARARALLETLLRDYPASPVRLEAGSVLEGVAAAASMRTPEPSPSQVPVVTAGPTVVPAPPAAGAAPSASTRAGRWTVQLGAFASPDRARAFQDEVAAAGTEVRLALVPANRLIRVRTGTFATQAEAEGLRAALAERGIEATVSGDADREQAAP